MCAVSMVIEQWKNPLAPNYVPWPVIEQDPMLARQMLEVIARLEAIDKRIGLLEKCSATAKEKAQLKRKLKRAASKQP